MALAALLAFCVVDEVNVERLLRRDSCCCCCCTRLLSDSPSLNREFEVGGSITLEESFVGEAVAAVFPDEDDRDDDDVDENS